MKKQIFAILFLLLACTVLTSCAVLQNRGSADSSSAIAMERHEQVKNSLDQLISAYESKNSSQFAELVSNRYSGEARIFATSLQRDFSTYHNVSLRYTINNITLDDNGTKAFVSITFTRDWTDIKTSKTMNITNETSLVFILENGVYRLYSQNQPKLFGLN